MAWGKAGSTTTTATGDSIDSGTITASEINQYMSHIITSSTFGVYDRYNGVSSGSLYHGRYQTNGTTDQTFQANQIYSMLDNSGGTSMSAGDYFNVIYQVNIATEEKLIIGHSIMASGTGTGTSPKRNQYVAKFANTTDQITSVSNTNVSAGDYLTDSNLTVLGSDMTPASAVTFPTNVQVGSRAEITDTRKMYNYTAPATAPTTTSHLEGHGQGVPNVTDTIDIPTTGLSNLATGSVSFWIYLETESTSAGDYVVLSGSNTGVGSSEFALGFVGHVTGVGIICRNNGSGVCTFTCPSSLTRNAWNHVVYTNNSSGNKVYVNGSQVTPSYSVGSASTNAFFNSVASINTCTIGANKDNGGYQWGYDGNLQQLLVYSAVLTQGEITALYNNGKYVEPSTTNLLRRYELTSNANDTSGNGHNGTASAGVTYTSLAIPEGSNEWKEIGT